MHFYRKSLSAYFIVKIFFKIVTVNREIQLLLFTEYETPTFANLDYRSSMVTSANPG